MKIFVSNLSFMTTALHLSGLFIQYGMVLSAKIIMDNKSGHSMGYGYIVMDKQSGKYAINALNNMNFMNHYIEVSEVTM